MSNTGVRGPQGPNEAERIVMGVVYDTFNSVLHRCPTDAKKMAYELAEVAAKYEHPQKGQKPCDTSI
jgi:hypothetical protein